jgi:flagellar hook-associated protein 3 FlgL
MRIATNQYNAMMQSALNTANSQMDAINLELATGQQYTVPSQNPVASVQLARLSLEDANITQYQANIGSLKSRLYTNETDLRSISNDILSANDLVLQAANGSNTADDEAAIGEAVAPLMQSMLYTANSQDAEGHYLYSGTLTNTPAITYDATAAVGSRYTFTGNSNQQLVTVASGVSQPANVSLPEMATLLNQLDTVQTDMSTPGVNVNDATPHADMEAAISGLATALNSITGKIADVGGQQNILTTINTNFNNVSASNQQTAITLGQVNYAAAQTELSGYTIAVEASYKSYAEVSKLTLFNAI